jgi:cyclohexanecarboxyl-CoA dehydrogenase
MAGFSFSEKQEMFRQEMRRFARKEIAPGSRERHRTLTEIPVEIRRKLGDLGLLGVNQPTEYGGQPGDYVSIGIAIEEIAKADFLVGGYITMPTAAIMAIRQGPKEAQDEWLPGLISGEKIVPPANTEDHCGSDAAAIRTTAVKDGQYYVLNGEKTAICQCLNAHAAIVFAKTDPKAGFRGVTAFLVPMNLPGISRFPINYIGWKPQGLGGFAMENVRIPEKYRLSEEGKGFYLAMSQYDFLRVGIALVALSMAQASLEEAIEYAKQRTAFGRPIASYQGTSFKLVEASTLVEAGRMLSYRALHMKDQGLVHTKESAMAKWFCPKIATEVIHNCVLALGHYGFTTDYPLAERLRDVVGLEIGDGTAEIMKTILVREIIGKDFV